MLNTKNNTMAAPVITPGKIDRNVIETGTDFVIVPVSTQCQREEAFRLKYLSYCIEQGYESAVLYPDGLYHDEYDKNNKSVWVLIVHLPTGIAVGTTRLIRDIRQKGMSHSLRCERVVDISHLRKEGEVGEISSVLISSQDVPEHGHISRIEQVRYEMGLNLGRRGELALNASFALTCGFFHLVYSECVDIWCAMMLRPLGRRFSSIINLHTDGIIRQDHGPRQLYVGFRETSLRTDSPCVKLKEMIYDKIILPFTRQQAVKV